MNHTLLIASRWLGCCLLAGCASSTSAAPPGRSAIAADTGGVVTGVADTAETPTSTPSPSHTAASARTATPQTPPPDPVVVASDVMLMTGGRFSPDHIGPEAFEETNVRFEAAPLAYLAETQLQLDKITRRESFASSFHAGLIARVADGHPIQAAAVARAVLPRYKAALAEARRAPAWDGEIRLLAFRVETLERVVAKNP